MKKFLESNKIYFDTVTATALTLMALIVSVNSYRLSNYQLELEKAKNSPSIRFESYLTMPVGRYGQSHIVFYNDGEKISELSVQSTEILQVLRAKDNKVLFTYPSCCEWDRFIVQKDFTGTGIIGDIRSYQPNIETYKDFLDKMKDVLFNFETRSFAILKIDYKDIYKQKRTIYKIITDQTDTPNYSDVALESMFKKYNTELNPTVQSVNFNNLSDSLINVWKTSLAR